MSQATTGEYMERYRLPFKTDMEFAKKFMPRIIQILDGIDFVGEGIMDNVGTDLDFQGQDLTIPARPKLSVGVRVRRAEFAHLDQFTQDDKERETMSCDVYFLGYATEDEERLIAFMVWDGAEYQKYRGTIRIPVVARIQNVKHSGVWFNCYQNLDIANNCYIYAISGRITRRARPLKFMGQR